MDKAESPTIKLISPQMLTLINMTVCKEEGLKAGPRDSAIVDMVLSQANGKLLQLMQDFKHHRLGKHFQAEFGNWMLPSEHDHELRLIWASAASALIFNIVKLTPYLNCNCGTAAVAARTWVYLNKFDLNTPAEEALEAVENVYNDVFSHADISRFIFDRIAVRR